MAVWEQRTHHGARVSTELCKNCQAWLICDLDDSGCLMHTDLTRAPSWSWVSVDGQIQFLDVSNALVPAASISKRGEGPGGGCVNQDQGTPARGQDPATTEQGPVLWDVRAIYAMDEVPFVYEDFHRQFAGSSEGQPRRYAQWDRRIDQNMAILCRGLLRCDSRSPPEAIAAVASLKKI